VGQYLLRTIASLFTILLKALDIFWAQGLGFPLTLVFGEKGKGFGPDLGRIKGGIFNTTALNHLGADMFYAT